MAAPKPYDRQSEESAKAYEAFALYRDMGIERSTDAVARQLRKSSALIQRWSSLYRWVERVAAWDAYIDQQAQRKVAKAAIDRKAAMLQRHAMGGRALQAFGLRYLQNDRMPDKGQDAISAIQRGVEIERKAEGLPEWIFEVVNADDSELLRQYHELLAEAGRAGSGDEAPGDTDPDAAESTAETPTD